MRNITQHKPESAEAEANKVNQNSIFISSYTNKACSSSQLNLSVVLAAQMQTMMQQDGACY